MIRNKQILICFFILLFSLNGLSSQTIEFTPGNEGTSYLKYNIGMSTASTAAGVGGFTASCTAGCNDDNTYRIRVSFDGGTNWYSNFSSMTATTGSVTGNGRFFTDGGLAQISISHEVLAGLSAWPGDDNAQGIKLQVYESETDTYYPTSAVSWTLDLTRPTINSATIASDNSTNTAYATTDDVITIGITASEDLINTGSAVFGGNISGLNFNTRDGSDATQWEFYNTVSTHAEQVVTYSIVYYDANYNVGASNLTTSTDGSTVTVDKTSPDITVSIASNNDVTSLAKHGDIVTLTIDSDEVLNGPPTVQISSNTSPVVAPSTASTNYTATHTLNQASDPQTAVTFSISSIIDRAGNPVSTITNTSDASSVTFDYTAPQLDVVSSSSNNALTSERAKADDVLTVSFTTDEPVQTPVVLIAGESSVEANANGDKATWVATKTMDAEDSDGEINFSINFTDLAGNTGTEVTKTGITSGSAVTFDNTAPTLASLTVASSNSTNSSYGIEDDIISLTILAAEDLQGDASKSPYGITAATIAGRSVDGNGNEIISKVDARNWSAQVQLNGSETSAPVSYSFTMTDLTGNQTAVDENISAIIIDNDVPELDLVSIASVSTDNDEYAKVGDVVKVSFTSNENLSSSSPPTGTIALSNASVTLTSGDAANRTIFESTLTTTNTTTEGTVAFTLAIEDLAGNTATVNATTDGSSVIFDRTTPLMSYARMTSSGTDTNFAKVSDIITLSIKANDKLKAAPTVTIFTNAATVSGSNADSLWTATYTLPAGLADGEVPFTLDFTDMAGNTGTQLTSTVNDPGLDVIYDEITPDLDLVDIYSNNTNNDTLAKVGNQITLRVESSEPIKAPNITIAGRTGDGAAALTDDTDDLAAYTSNYTMLTGDTEGKVAFSIDFTDRAGNVGTQVTHLTDDGGDADSYNDLLTDSDNTLVTFDKTPPYFNETTAQGAGVISISSSNDDNTLAKLGDVITLSLTSTEQIKTGSDPTVTINSNNATVSRASDNKTFTATYTMSSTDGSIDISAIPFSISSYEDLAGNEGATVTNSTTDGTSVKYDPVRPTLSNIVMVSDNDNNAYAKLADEIELTFESSETINTPTVTMNSSSDNITVSTTSTNEWKAVRTVVGGDTEDEVAFTISFSDLASNNGSNGSGGAIVSTTTSGTVVTIDRTGPTISMVDIATDNSIDPQYAVPADDITVTVLANEAIQSPTVTIMQNSDPTVSAVSGFSNRKWQAVHTAGNAENVGTVTFSVDVLDLAGNARTDGQITAIDGNDVDGNNVTYDNTAPALSSITFTSNNPIDTQWANDGDIVTVTFEANEQLLQSSISVTLASAYSATVNPGTAWNGTKEVWTAAYVVPEDMVSDNNIIPFTIDYRDIFTVPGEQEVNGVTGNIIYDGDPPALSLFTVTSNNDNDPKRAKEGDVITVTIKGDEKLAKTADPYVERPAVTIAGTPVNATASDDTDSTWTATYAMQSSDTEGDISILVDYKDYAGNEGPTLTQAGLVPSSTAVVFDKTSPTLTAVSIESNNSNTSMAKVGDQITISFTGSHQLHSSPTVTIDPDNEAAVATVAQGANATLWTATYVLLDSDTEGALSFSIAFEDLAANGGVPVTDVSDGSSVVFDKTATVVSTFTIDLDTGSDSGQLDDDNYTNVVRPTFTVSGLTTDDNAAAVATNDSLLLFIGNSGVRYGGVIVDADEKSIQVSEGLELASSPNPYMIKFKTRDSAGNLSLFTDSLEIIIDTEVPTVGGALDLKANSDTGISDTDDITNKTNPTLNISGLEPKRLSDIKLYYSRAGVVVADTFLLNHTLDTPKEDEIDIPTSLALSEDQYTFWYTVADSAGNVSNNSANFVMNVDLTAPSVSVAPDLVDDGNGDGFNEYDTGTSNTDNVTNLETVKFRVSGLSLDDNSIVIVDTGADPDSDVVEETIDNTTMDVIVNTISTTTYAAKVTDAAGNSSALSDEISITFDNTPTDVDGFDDPLGITPDNYADTDFNEYPPITIDLVGSTDTGLDTTDNITFQTLPSFRIKNLTATDSIFLYATVAGNELNLVAKDIVDNSSEILTVDASTPLSQNAYEVKLRTKDYAGNLSAFTSLLLNDANLYVDSLITLTIDTSPFVIAEDPDLIIEDDTGISGADNITSVRNPRIQFNSLEEGSPDSIALFITDPSGSTSLSRAGVKVANDVDLTLQVPSNLTSGDYIFKYKVIDLAGNESELSNGVTVTIDYTAPSDPADLDLIASDDNGPSDTDNLTNASSMSITSSGLVAGEYGFLYLWDGAGALDVTEDTKIDSVLLQNEDGGVATFTITNSVDATLDYYVIARDFAGNASLASAAPTLQVNVDLTPPVVDDVTISLDSGSDTGILGDNAGFNTTPTFTVTESELGLTVTDSVVIFYSLKPNSQDPGSGLNGAAKRYAALPIDAVSENLVGTGFDENGDGTIDDGSYSITAKIRDFAGNLSNASAEIIYRLDTQAPVPPGDLDSLDMLSIFDSGFSDSDNYTNNTGPQFIVTDLEPFKKDSIKLYAQKGFTNFYVSGSVAGDDPPEATLTTWVDAADGDGNFNGSFDAGEGFELTEGSWLLTYTIKDSAGNVTSIRDSLNATIDLTSPSAPIISDLPSAYDTGVLANDNLTNLSDLRITLKGLVSLDIGELYLYDGDGGFDVTQDTRIDSALFDSDSLFFEPSELVSGVNEFYSTAIDRAGNLSSLSPGLQVTVDLDAPLVDDITITLDPGSDTGILLDNAGSNTTPTFTVADPVSGLTLTDSLVLFYALRQNSQDPGSGLNGDAKRYAALSIDDAASESLFGVGFDENADGNMDDGSYTISARLKDYAGNFSAPAEALVYRLDTQAPIFWDEASNQLDPSSSFLAPDLMTEDDKGYSATDNITNTQNPSFVINNMHPFLNDQLIVFARKGFSTTAVDTGFVSELKTDDTLTVPWVDGNADDEVDDGEGFALDDGTWTITYTVTDSAGNVAPESPALTIEVDAIDPPALGTPDLIAGFDTGESNSDNLTNLGTIDLDQTDTIPGFKWVLYSATDNGDGTYNEVEDVPVIPLDSNLFPGGQGDDGLDLDGDGTPDGARSITSNISVNVDPTYHFFSVHEDVAGNRAINSDVLTVGVDFVEPTCAITYDDPDGDGLVDNLVRFADGALKATFTFDKAIDDLDNPPRVVINYPDPSWAIDTVLISKEDAASDLVWEYSIPLNDLDMDTLNGFINLEVLASDRYGNPVSAVTGVADIRIDNLPAVFSNVNPGSGSFNNADSLVAFSWNLNEPNDGESIVSAQVTFNNLGDNSSESVSLGAIDLVEGDRPAGLLPGWNNDPYTIPIAEGLYEVIFTSLDSAGNIGNDTLSNFTYDTLRPTADITFSRLYAEDGDTVVVTILFDEDMLNVESDPPVFTADLPSPGGNLVTTGPMVLVNVPESYDDFGLDGVEGNGDQGDQNGQYDIGETIYDLNGNGVLDLEGDLFTWKYTYVPGDGGVGAGLDGLLSNIVLTNAKDLADNLVQETLDLDANDDGIDDILYLDNTNETATFTYENLTNPSLTDGDPEDEGFTGIGGDSIRVTVTTDLPVSATSPVPTIDLEYNTAIESIQGDILLGVNLAVPNTDSTTWVFEIVLADSIWNDGEMTFGFNAKDLADNVVETENLINQNKFAVDNLPPAFDSTGSVLIIGGENQNWITSNTNSIGVTVPIPSTTSTGDTTLQNGLVEIQFFNTNRGLGWVTINANDTITENNQDVIYYRDIDSLYAVMDSSSAGNGGIQPGDVIAVRAKIIDKHANVTAFATSTDSLRFDPRGPVIGEIISGVFGTTSDGSIDTVYSSDQVDIAWTSFAEIDPQESGLKEYLFTILKRDSTTAGQLVTFKDTLLTNPPDTSFSEALFLTHGSRYVAQIVGIDTAGNYSDTLSSDTLLRLNSAPVFGTVGGENIFEDVPWTKPFQITDLDLTTLQGDTHTYAIDTTTMDTTYVDEGTVRGGTYRDVYLSYNAIRQDDYYTGCIIKIETDGGPQFRKILSYEGATRTATVSDGTNDLSPAPTQGNPYFISPSMPTIDPVSGLISWTPREKNVGSFDISVTVTDGYNLADTADFTLVVQVVNDPPESFLGDSLSVVTWQEDTSTTINLGKYFYDVDSEILEAGGFEWSVVVLGTEELDEDFPLGIVIPGPGASNEFHAKLTRQYMGFDPNMNFTSQNLTSARIQQINSVRDNHLLQVQIYETADEDGDGDNDSTMALFISDTNYYGADHSVIFIGTDLGDATVMDTISAVIVAKNDPPKIATLPDTVMYENDSLWLKFGYYTSDVDDDTLKFTISAVTNDNKMTILPMGTQQEFLMSSSVEDSILFVPSPLWSDQAVILVTVEDDQVSDTSSFILDIERVLRPHFSVSVTQNNAFNKYFQIIVIDTVEKATFVSLDVANSQRTIDEIADYTYIAHVYMESSGNYPIDVSANAVVGDTTIREYFSLAAGRASSRWAGQSFDGRFSVVGNPGAIAYDQSLLIIDSTLFDKSFQDKASYVLGNEDFEFNQPIEVRMANERDDLAIYRRKNGSIWEELPSISKGGEIFTLSEKAGYFKLGRKTIIVPEETNIHQNYPNPFNPTTTIMYDIGLLDGLKQRVSISVYNLLGQHVTTLIENKDQIGQFKIQWDGTNKFGQQMSSGVYFIQLSTKTGIVRNKKMMLLK